MSDKTENLQAALKECWTMVQRLENSQSEETKYNNYNENIPDFSKVVKNLVEESKEIPELNFCDMPRLKKLFLNNYFAEEADEAKTLHIFGYGKENNPKILCFSNKNLTKEQENFLRAWFKPINLDLYTDCYTTSLMKGQEKRTEELNAYFLQQMKLIKPEVVFALGEEAAQFLKDPKVEFGKFFTYESVVCISTYNPETVIKDKSLKRPVWKTLLSLAKYLKIQI